MGAMGLVRRWELWQQPSHHEDAPRTYTPQEAARAADLIWAGRGGDAPGGLAAGSPRHQSHAHFTQEPVTGAKTAATA
jgi:hypothetical protein